MVYRSAADLAVRETNAVPSATSLASDDFDRDDFLLGVSRLVQESVRSPHRRDDLIRTLLELGTDPRLLSEAFRRCASRGGIAPGSDGLTYDSYTRQGRYDAFRALRRSILDGAFARSRLRPAFGPRKSDSDRRRLLRLPIVLERVLQKTLLRLIEPYLDEQFAPFSFGFRRRLSHHDALRSLRSRVEDKGCVYFCEDDIRSAFANVPIQQLHDIVAKFVPNPAAVELMMDLVRAGGSKGLAEGASLSPLFLNLYLHRVHDCKFTHALFPPMRYADNFGFAATSPVDVLNARETSRRLLESAALKLKGPADAIDLRQREAEWLGFELKVVARRLRIRVSEKGLRKLGRNLDRCRRLPNATWRAKRALYGWLSDVAPHLEERDHDETVQAVRRELERRTLGEAVGDAGIRRHLRSLRSRTLRKLSEKTGFR